MNTPLLLGLLTVVLPIGLVAGAVSWALTGWSIHLAHKRDLLADVNERSSHTTPTPRVGGIGLVGGLLVGFVVLLVMVLAPTILPPILQSHAPEFMSVGRWLGLLLPVLLAFALGFWDDRSDPPAVAKLAGQALIALIPPLLGIRLQTIVLPFSEAVIHLPMVVSVLVSAAWILLVMNAVNFMDGINGLAGTFGRRVALFLLVATWNFAGWEWMLPLCAALWGASSGFLMWNVPNARTFMGDCGSQPLGVLAALLALHFTSLPTTHPLPFLAAVAIMSIFLFDVILTLIRRSMRGENILKAHREHLYQRYLVTRGEDHRRTLRMVDFHLIATGLLGAYASLLFSTPGGGIGRGVLLLLCGAALVSYLCTVRMAEGQFSAGRGTS
ncbi:MAG: undecaprenyl/decaprenyl-phosphate alpha-N-acetylglucosaminyl 1-phosphate transferase [Candidatus Sumerlaeia bacterium]|nr:undecaprenyl/decaprenyl-phosphate alpha-N-acetylglucosaminyl 1-phosphate transferase [Candidatus Sumerlaeia bacterium]